MLPCHLWAFKWIWNAHANQISFSSCLSNHIFFCKTSNVIWRTAPCLSTFFLNAPSGPTIKSLNWPVALNTRYTCAILFTDDISSFHFWKKNIFHDNIWQLFQSRFVANSFRSLLVSRFYFANFVDVVIALTVWVFLVCCTLFFHMYRWEKFRFIVVSYIYIYKDGWRSACNVAPFHSWSHICQ